MTYPAHRVHERLTMQKSMRLTEAEADRVLKIALAENRHETAVIRDIFRYGLAHSPVSNPKGTP
jgi:hypothetical protein